MNTDLYLTKKAVDKSTLYQGVSIPVAFQKLLYEKVGITLARGESTQIKILIRQPHLFSASVGTTDAPVK